MKEIILEKYPESQSYAHPKISSPEFQLLITSKKYHLGMMGSLPARVFPLSPQNSDWKTHDVLCSTGK
jgi:hypothetical protein